MNLACALAVAGKRVLAIDSDPHGNLADYREAQDAPVGLLGHVPVNEAG